MAKHAYCIIAHAHPQVLLALLSQIDDPENDIFLHIDKKWKHFPFEEVGRAVTRSRLYYAERHKVAWGGYSQIESEMALLKKAASVGQYTFYHLLSGQDLCLRSQAEIHAFFDQYAGDSFLTFCGEDWNRKAEERIRYYHLDSTRGRLRHFAEKVWITLQKVLRVNRLKKTDLKVVGGCNWASLSDEAVRYLLEAEPTVKRVFAHGWCVDELYKHTMLYNSPLRDRIFLVKIPPLNNDMDPDMHRANARFIDWNRGKPYTFTKEDYSLLIASDCAFARKFSAETDGEIIRALCRHTNSPLT